MPLHCNPALSAAHSHRTRTRSSKNLERLGTKITSGGKDDGYGKYKEPPKKDLGKAASQFFFKRGYEDN